MEKINSLRNISCHALWAKCYLKNIPKNFVFVQSNFNVPIYTIIGKLSLALQQIII